jgi:hypothetical protein
LPDVGHPDAWYHPVNNPDKSWAHHNHQDTGGDIALYTPPTMANLNGAVQSIADFEWDRGFVWVYRTCTPEPANDGTWPDNKFGVAVHWGIEVGGQRLPQASLLLLAPTTDTTAEEDNAWRLVTWTDVNTYVHLDKRPQPTGGSFDAAAENAGVHWIMVLPVCGRLCIFHSRMNGCWVYAPQGGTSVRSGRMAFQFVGCRGWCQFGRVVYPDSCTIQSPPLTLSNQITRNAIICACLSVQKHVNGDYDATAGYVYTVDSVGADSFVSHYVETITNHTTRRYTPLLLALQEIHEPLLAVRTPGDAVDLSTYLHSISSSRTRAGKGATGKLVLRDFLIPTAGAPQSFILGWLTSRGYHRGINRWTMTVTHKASDNDVGPLTHGTWYGVTPEFNQLEGKYPMIEWELRDRKWLLDRVPMLFLPDFAGWLLRDAVRLIGLFAEVLPTELTMPADDVADPIMIPWQEAGSATKFSSRTSASQALDRLCQLTYCDWRIERDGTLTFFRIPYATPAPTWNIDSSATAMNTLTVAPAAVRIDNADLSTCVYVRGRDRYGYDVDYIVNAGPDYLSDVTKDTFVGRRLWRTEEEPDNPDPGGVAMRYLVESLQKRASVSFRILGRDLWPGAIVDLWVDYRGVAAGTKFIIEDMRDKWETTSKDGRWWTDFTADLVGDTVT